MEKTIKQLSEEYGITKQAMRKRINQLPPTTVSTGANRTILINEDGQEILRKKLAVKELNKVTIEVSTKQLTSDNQLILELKHKIDLLEQENQFQNEKIMSLQKQLDEKKKTILFYVKI